MLVRGAVGVAVCVVFPWTAWGDLGPEHVLILVNGGSPTSRYVARLYREYHPGITDSQVLTLSGLADCSGPASTAADEILTRGQYETLIADPVRAYLLDGAYPERWEQVRVIVTTAGLPYRIEDSAYSNVVYPAGSHAPTVVCQEASIDAATVESELTCLWYSNYGSDTFGQMNRMVNPYQGYRGSSVTLFDRVFPGLKDLNWAQAYSTSSPLVQNPVMEGDWPTGPWMPPFSFGTTNRRFHAGDMYLTCRLDGPKAQGKSAVFAVRAMLERSRRASDPGRGVNPAKAVAVLDDAPNQSEDFDRNRTFNLTSGVNCLRFSTGENQPADAPGVRVVDDYGEAYLQFTGDEPGDEGLCWAEAGVASGMAVVLDRRGGVRTSQADLEAWASSVGRPAGQQVMLLATYGVNGDEGRNASYLSTGGESGGPLFSQIANGAVFTSIESFNAVTMFSDVATASTAQGKLVDFLGLGGTAAIGHGFEPQPDAAIDNEFLLYNVLSDENGDGRADLTWVEAAFTALPYVSWSEVVLGDPLMRVAYGPGGEHWTYLQGDATNDGCVNYADIWYIKGRMGASLYSTNPEPFAQYNDLYDVNQDGYINYADVWYAKGQLGATSGP